jgi:phosphoglycolate phosphatase
MDISNSGLRDIRLLIFDLDGTLVDSGQDIVLSTNAMRQAMGLEPLDFETVASYVGHGIHVLVKRAMGADAGPQSLEKATQFFINYYRDHLLDHTVPYPGVKEALQALRGRLGVLTNKDLDLSQRILDGLELAQYFEFVYGGNSFERKKPDPIGILMPMRVAGVEARQTMMVGDAETDIQTGRNAGVWTCGVTYGIGSHTLESCPPDFLVGNLMELPALLNGSRMAGSERR